MTLAPEQLLEWADKVEEATIAAEVDQIISSFPLRIKFDPDAPVRGFIRVESDCHGFDPPKTCRRYA